MEGRGETSEGEMVRGRHCVRAVGVGRGTVGGVGYERAKPYSTAAVGLPAVEAWRRRVRDKMSHDGRKGTAEASVKGQAAEMEPRAQPGRDHGWFGVHVRLNETQQRAPEDLNPMGARLSRDVQVEKEGGFPTLLCQWRPWVRRGPLPSYSSVRRRWWVIGKARRKWRSPVSCKRDGSAAGEHDGTNCVVVLL